MEEPKDLATHFFDDHPPGDRCGAAPQTLGQLAKWFRVETG